MAFLDELGLTHLWEHISSKLSSKVDKVEGKVLSTNDYTTEEKNKLAGINTSTYETKTDAETKFNSAKSYADTAASNAAATVKNELLNGAGEAYDTLKELGDLITTNTDALDALQTIANGKTSVTVKTWTAADITA